MSMDREKAYKAAANAVRRYYREKGDADKAPWEVEDDILEILREWI